PLPVRSCRRSGLPRRCLPAGNRLARLAPRSTLPEPHIRPEDVIRGCVGVSHHEHVLRVATRKVHARLDAVREYQDLSIRNTEALEQAHELPGLRLVVVERIDHDERVLARTGVECALACKRLHLAVDALRIVTR